MTKKAKATEFKRVIRNGVSAAVKTLPGGGEVYRISDEQFDAYDPAGRFLGWANNQPEAEYMAENGYPNQMDDVSDLSLWCMWNDALHSGERPLEDEDGTQFLLLPNKIVMSAKADEHGYTVSLMPENDFWEMYRSEKYPDVLALKLAAKPLELE